MQGDYNASPENEEEDGPARASEGDKKEENENEKKGMDVSPVPSTGVDTASAAEPSDEYDVDLGADFDAMGVPADEEE